MPLKVRIQVALWIMAGLAVVSALIAWSWPVGLGVLILVLLYVEMIYPKWNFFGSAIKNVKAHGKNKVAITFDDGPSPHTEKILDILREKQVKASFFLLGKNIERHPEIAKRIASEGHAVGLHAYSHTKLNFKGPRFVREELSRSEDVFRKYGIRHDRLFRFPHGFKNIFGVLELKRRGLRLCAWGRGVWDSKRPGVSVIVERSLQLKPGEILLLHDGDGVKENPDRSQTVNALPGIIDGLKAKGLEFAVLSSSS